MNNDTICAVATAMTDSGIGIIRLSGEEAILIADRVINLKSGKKLCECKTHTIHYGFLYYDTEKIDEVMVSIMKSPASYTREDVVEINCHGGVTVMKSAMKTVISSGARLAEPGEFTKRAFLNGRIDLSEAEAVMDLIESKNDYARRNSLRQLSGSLKQKINEIRQSVIHEIAFIEAALDDPEHYNFDGYNDRLKKIILDVDEELLKLIHSAENGRFMKNGIETVILGKPNVGKSSLLNLLSGEEKAIVTDIAGTTRDIIKEFITIGGIGIHLSDTAGIHNTEDKIEQIGVFKAMESASNADLILYMMDSVIGADEEDDKILEKLTNRNLVILFNKSDLTSDPIIEKQILQYSDRFRVIPISAKENKGIEQLENEIKKRFLKGDISYQEELCITNLRHLNLLKEAHNSALLVQQAIDDDLPQDFYTVDMMNLYTSLGMIIGEEVGEDLVNEIFAKFCTGK